MSRIGKQPINIPIEVEVKIEGNRLNVKGPKGTINKTVHSNMKIEFIDNKLYVKRQSDLRLDKSL
ncbi:MAG: 50S ribosomal protein L6, partial [Nitrospinota bacterium]